MNKFLGISLLLLIASACSSEDKSNSDPFSGDVVLESQLEVDEFGSNNYSGVNGTLRITLESTSNASNITDLRSLNSLGFVTGDLDVFNNGVLTNLSGLNNITEIGGSLTIGFNNSLTNLDGLSNLMVVGNNLLVFENENLANIDAFSGLNIVPGNLNIGVNYGAGAFSNPSLTDINGLSNISTVGGNLQVSGSNTINLQPLSGITNVAGDLIISFNESLETLEGLQNVGGVAYNILITQNSNLNNLNALAAIQTVGGDLEVSSNNQLTDISGLKNITEIGGFLSMSYNESLTNSISAYEDLTSVSGIVISDSFLEELNDFPNLTSCNFIIIGNNIDLNRISGFNSLLETSSLSINDNENLTVLDAFSNLVMVDNFVLEQPSTIIDPSITISGFANLTTVHDDIKVEGIANTNLDFLAALMTVGDDLSVQSNENLADLCGLNNLILNGGLVGDFNVFQNLYNPTIKDMQNGDCSL